MVYFCTYCLLSIVYCLSSSVCVPEEGGVEDAIAYMLHKSLSHLDRASGAVKITFLDFSSAFNTIQPRILRHKLMEMGVDAHLVAWITDYLTDRPQYVHLGDCRSATMVSSTGAPQGTVLPPALFTLYRSDFQYNSESCHVQKFADDTPEWAVSGIDRRRSIGNLSRTLSNGATRTTCVSTPPRPRRWWWDFRRPMPHPQPVIINGECVEQEKTYKNLGVQLDDKLDWTANTDAQ